MMITSSGALIEALRLHHLLSPEQSAELPHLAHGRGIDARALAKVLHQRGWLTPFQINKLLAGNAKDLVIGPYQILDLLGQGGLSQVFKARHREHGWIVALKAIRPEAMTNTEGRQQFLQEMEAMARLDHPNIVQFCDLDQAGETYYFAMEYVEGIDLGKHVALGGPLATPLACDYIRQTALGLQHAHERNVIHRDIKPVNLFLTYIDAPDQTPLDRQTTRCQALIKILDWGLATLRLPKGAGDPDAPQPVARGIVGTADYLAPEQARNHLTVDIRGDIYSLGCTFYFLLTGRPPFPDGKLMQKILQHQQGEPEHISHFRSDVPAELVALLKRMMAKDPSHRFQTPAALALALNPFTRHDAPDQERLSRKINRFKPASPPTSRDNTPLPAVLANRAAQTGPHRTQPPAADTAYPLDSQQ